MIQKVVDTSLQYKSYIKKQIIIIKNTLAIVGRVFYIVIILQSVIILEISYLSSGSITFTNLYNKVNKIIIKLNNKDVAQVLNSKSIENIMESINQYVKIKNIMDKDI